MRSKSNTVTWLKAAGTVAATAWALYATGCETAKPLAEAMPEIAVPAPVVELRSAPPAPTVTAPSEVVIGDVVPTPIVILPGTYAGRMKAAKVLMKKGTYDDAAAMYSAALELEEHAPPMIELARIALMHGEVKTARKHAEAAVALAGDSTGAWNTLGRVELMDADSLAAIAAFQHAVEADPTNGYAWNNLGLALVGLRRYEEAVVALEKATGTADVQTYMWNNLGLAYEGLGQVDMARAAYGAAARKGSPVAKHALARLEGEPMTGSAIPTLEDLNRAAE